MAVVTKTHSAVDTVSDLIFMPPGATVAFEAVVAGGETFTGQLNVEMARTPSGPWQQARNAVGDAIGPYTSEAATTTEETVKNHSAHQMYLRSRVRTFTGDNIVVTLTDIAGDEVHVVLRDANGVAVITKTDDGYQWNGDLQLAGTAYIDSGLQVGGDTALQGAASVTLDYTQLRQAEYTIAAADIVATGAGKFGHANGYPLFPDSGVDADKVFELISAILIYDFGVAAYTAGGNITVNHSNGGAAITGLVSAANSVGAASDKVVQLLPLAAAGNALVKGNGINLVTSAAFTDPGTAVGVIRVIVTYRIHATGL